MHISKFFSTVFILWTLPVLQADTDTPTPLLLKESADRLQTEAAALAKKFKIASKGKNWGASPGHTSLYKSIFSYGNGLKTTSAMCKSGESPDRLFKIVLETRALGKRLKALAVFLILPDAIKSEIIRVSNSGNELIPCLKEYESRYFIWKKIETQKTNASELKKLETAMSALTLQHTEIQNQNNALINKLKNQCHQPPQRIIIQFEPQHSPSENKVIYPSSGSPLVQAPTIGRWKTMSSSHH